jgi:hypothetical protein
MGLTPSSTPAWGGAPVPVPFVEPPPAMSRGVRRAGRVFVSYAKPSRRSEYADIRNCGLEMSSSQVSGVCQTDVKIDWLVLGRTVDLGSGPNVQGAYRPYVSQSDGW